MYNLKDIDYNLYPKGRGLKSNMTKLRSNLADRLNYSKIFILCQKLTLLIMPHPTEEIVTYLQNEIDEMMDDKNWGGLVKELYNPSNLMINNIEGENLSETNEVQSEKSHKSEVEEAQPSPSQEARENYELETKFGSDYGELLQNWYFGIS